MAAPTNTPLYRFGAGQLWCVPNAGNLATNPTPVRLATLQEFSIEFSGDIKELFGENQYPEVVAVGKRKITGKMKIGRWNTFALNELLFSGTMSTGMELVNINEAATVPAMTPFTYTVTNHTTFVEDLGVHYPNGNPFQVVSALTAVQQYQVNASTGVYTFDSADASNTVQIDYLSTSTSGFTLEVDNTLMGYGPVFQTVFRSNFRGQECNIVLNACVSNKLSLQSKTDDFTVPEIDFAAFADANGKIGFVYSAL